MKAIVLKPVMWNSQGYHQPAGDKATSGYAADYGYGHEEWNNNPDRIWNDQRIFHTQSTEKLDRYANSKDLGMIIIASHKGTQYALGVATSIQDNDDDMEEIAKALNFYDEKDRVWSLPRVQHCFQNDKEAFEEHWFEQHEWIRWRCPQEQYTWFEQPIALDPLKITGAKKLVSMHGRHQAISPATALEILKPYLPTNHPSMEWLSTGTFDPDAFSSKSKIPANFQISSPELRKQYGIRACANSTVRKAYEYWIEGQRSVNPMHHELQQRFVEYLKKELKVTPVEDEQYVDVRYPWQGNTVFAEIKPTDMVSTRYAIRAAIGQLLEYRFRQDQDAMLEIVLGSEPTEKEIEFVNSLNISISWPEDSGFITRDPE